ncbi:EAL domain-containing protein [Antarcticimicrobium sediminis]|uniref:EAL domain-containing protein n=1 Tax=Antarcticimicrobium sediminis TaxID=2546227 RepID=A0A4R5EXG7_9RHOB|nr:EAL domain-containing protein [Antarcticimicrobium sediminis]TDE39653.1 EAL domain-containing protein [Antarcticimicrobium sediminis]
MTGPDIPHRPWADIPHGADSPLNAAVADRDSSTLDMVRAAVWHRQCLLAFQPVVQATSPRKTAFYEGLIRVLDATGRVIPARDFMPAIEANELGRQIDCIALDMGLRALAENPTLRLSINMSARSIGYGQWMRTLERALRADSRLGERLILEISEHSAMTVPELVIDFMDRLQGHGIAFALDDFGSGAIAIRYFRDFFFDAVKIDGEFIRKVQTDQESQATVRALIAMAREFEMLTIAVAVETQEESDCLIGLGIDCMQGYLFGAPTVHPAWMDKASARATAS